MTQNSKKPLYLLPMHRKSGKSLLRRHHFPAVDINMLWPRHAPQDCIGDTSEVQRALLLPQEVITLPRDEQIILIESFTPIKTKKIFYYKDHFFKKRLLPKEPIPQQEPYDPRKKKAEAPAKPEENTSEKKSA